MGKLHFRMAILLVVLLSYSYNMIEARECKGCLHNEETWMKNSVDCESNCDLANGCFVSLVDNECHCDCSSARAPTPSHSNATAPSPSEAKAPAPSQNSTECGSNCDLVNGCFVTLVGNKCHCECPSGRPPTPSNATAPTPSPSSARAPDAKAPTPSPSNATAPTPSQNSTECGSNCDLVNGCFVSLVNNECQCKCPNDRAPTPSNV